MSLITLGCSLFVGEIVKTIGIYGDSFADIRCRFTELVDKAWPNLLKTHYDVTNYAVGGSSVYYSYKNFIDTHTLYDKIIFVSTTPGRWKTPYTIEGNTYHINSPVRVDFIFKRHPNITPVLHKKLTTLKDYFIYLQDSPEYAVDNQLCDLMLKDVKQTRPDAIIIPWNDMVAYQKFFWECFKYNTDIADLKRDFSIFEETNVICHMSAEVNQLVFENVEIALNNGNWQLNLPDPFIHPNPFSYYFCKTKD